MNPYSVQPPRSFWRTAVARQSRDHLPDLWQPKFRIGPDTGFITAGSCFSQHMGRALIAKGFRWIDAEPAPTDVPPDQQRQKGYGIFSFRTGNIYSAALLHHWLAWATGDRPMPREVWRDGDHYFDPFRPSLDDTGFAGADALYEARERTLAAIREAFAQADILLFTMGLTETWWNRATGTPYPACPGTIRGRFDPDLHHLRNHGFVDIRADMEAAIGLMRRLNPAIRLLLTVSPVPITATAGTQHALVASTHTKSVLRAVAGDLAAADDSIDYFPSYELITAPPFRGQHYEENLRTIRPEGVDFVMEHFFQAAQATTSPRTAGPAASPEAVRQALAQRDILCDDQILDYYGSP